MLALTYASSNGKQKPIQLGQDSTWLFIFMFAYGLVINLPLLATLFVLRTYKIMPSKDSEYSVGA